MLVKFFVLLSKIEIFVKNRFLCQEKRKFRSKNENFGQKMKILSKKVEIKKK